MLSVPEPPKSSGLVSAEQRSRPLPGMPSSDLCPGIAKNAASSSRSNPNQEPQHFAMRPESAALRFSRTGRKFPVSEEHIRKRWIHACRQRASRREVLNRHIQRVGRVHSQDHTLRIRKTKERSCRFPRLKHESGSPHGSRVCSAPRAGSCF